MQLDYETFTLEILREVKSRIGENAEIGIHQVVKNNGVILTGLTIRKQGGKTAPNIYLEDFYCRFQKGTSLMEIVSEILAIYQERKDTIVQNLDFFADFDRVQDRILFKLINRNMNREMLVNVPYLPFLDFAVTFYYFAEDLSYGKGSIQITNGHMGMWNTTKQQLYHLARRNTRKLRPAVILSMGELLADYGLEMEEDPRCSLYIITNEDKTFGASGILYDQELQRAGEILGADYYILPSSIHEVLLISDQVEMEKDELSAMVREINEKQVPREEVLSDHIYHYERMSHRFSAC